jgi:hypothetical protein
MLVLGAVGSCACTHGSTARTVQEVRMLKTYDDRAIRFIERGLELARRAGVPGDDPIVHLTTAGPIDGQTIRMTGHIGDRFIHSMWRVDRRSFDTKIWHGWWLEYVGTRDRWMMPGQTPSGCLVLDPGAGIEPLVIRFWVQRAWRQSARPDGVAPVAERWWAPDGELTDGVRWPTGTATTPAEREDAARGFDLLNLVDRIGRGRPSNVAKPHPVKVALAQQSAALHEREPALSWDQIAARLGTKYTGKTLQKWVEVQRLHER